MKLLTLEIKGYKNLENVALDFKDCSNYCALIGLNGSGKSNVLEAISIIFSSLYHGTDIDFEYSISYKIDNFTVEIKREKRVSFKVNSETVKKDDYETYLPSNIIACYSGEELRMWEHTYIKSYGHFFRDIKNDQNTSIPRLLYVNKYIWEYALIALLCMDKDSYPKIKTFTEDVLKINDNDVKISFDFDFENINDYPRNSVIDFIEELNNTQVKNNNELSIDQIQTSSYKVFSSTEVIREMFYSLFITGMPVKNKKAQINVDKIIRKTEVKFNNIDVKKLSEGEKKLILIYTITQLLADEKTLVLLDEPDAHIHIERKKEIIDIIKDSKCFTLFTTHSPKVLTGIEEENLVLIKNSDSRAEIMKSDKIRTIRDITNGEFSIIDATLALSTTKNILLVEGTYDCKYIKKAMETFSPEYDDLNLHIMNCGGADNIPTVLEESLLGVLSSSQKCICLFDYDNPGQRNYDKVKKITEERQLNNVFPMYHPKPDGSIHEGNEIFLMENYFPIEAYKNIIIDSIKKKETFEALSEYQKPKSIIQKIYVRLAPEHFQNFRVLLDKLKEKYNS